MGINIQSYAVDPIKLTLPNNEKSLDIGATSEQSFAITDHGNLYFWGLKPFNIRFDYFTIDQVSRPTNVRSLKKDDPLLQIANFDIMDCSMYYCIFIDTTQRIKCGWGYNEYFRFSMILLLKFRALNIILNQFFALF